MASVRGNEDVKQKLLQWNTLIGGVAGTGELRYWGITGTWELLSRDHD